MKIKIGDLVCYNGAGQKSKTLGLVIDLILMAEPSAKTYLHEKDSILIQWCCIGNGVLPRKSHHHMLEWSRKEIASGDIVWHEIGNWFEVVK